MIIFDTTGRIISTNATAKEIFGYNKGFCPKKIDELFDKKNQELLWEICHALLNKEVRHNNMLIIPDLIKDGKQVVLELYFNNHVEVGGESLIAVMVRDETRKWKDKHELRQSHERFKKIFKKNPVAQIIVCARDGVIIDINEQFQELFGYSREEVIGRDIAAIGLDHNGMSAIQSVQKKAINGHETTVCIKNGQPITVLQSLVMIKVDDMPHIFWTFVDITERIEAETHLMQLYDELEAKVQDRTKDLTVMLEREKHMNDMKSRFVSMASHEFRSPLTTILASTNLLETYIKQSDTENIAKRLARINSSVKRLTETLEDFLSLDKIEQGQTKSHMALFDLKKFTEDILNQTESSLKKGQAIECTHTGGQHIIQDENILKTIVTNLLSNASKYSEEGSTIKWSVAVKRKKIIITITDNGIGIPADEQDYIFSQFFRAKNAEVYQGTGLGLNIVKKYIDILGGKISFVSTENIGTTFIVELPVINKKIENPGLQQALFN